MEWAMHFVAKFGPEGAEALMNAIGLQMNRLENGGAVYTVDYNTLQQAMGDLSGACKE